LNSNTFLVVGLGNPGPDYSHNRHNVGQMVLDVLASRIVSKFKSHKAGAQVAEGKIAGTKLILAKSNGFMNNSGAPTAALMKFYDLLPEQLEYIRLRFGIGRPPGSQDAADFVLKNFSATERAELPVLLELAADMVQTIATDGLLSAQSHYHAK